jgi:hypothetical protein
MNDEIKLWPLRTGPLARGNLDFSNFETCFDCVRRKLPAKTRKQKELINTDIYMWSITITLVASSSPLPVIIFVMVTLNSFMRLDQI